MHHKRPRPKHRHGLMFKPHKIRGQAKRMRLKGLKVPRRVADLPSDETSN